MRQHERRSRLSTRMFRLIRLFVLLAVAFAAGFLYSETSRQDRCTQKGGVLTDGLCMGATG